MDDAFWQYVKKHNAKDSNKGKAIKSVNDVLAFFEVAKELRDQEKSAKVLAIKSVI